MRSSLSAIGNVTKEQFLKLKIFRKWPRRTPYHGIRGCQPLNQICRFSSKVLVPLLVVNSKLSVLFTKRSIHLKQHRGEVCFPGGKMESEETAEETALRETHEEIGLDPKSVEVWGRLKPVLTRTLVETVVPVVGCINEDALNSKLMNKNEVQTLFSAPLDELCQTARYTHFSTKMVDFKLPVFFTKEFTIFTF
ncbi:hydrolase, NUDIX family [Oesophagostomum dentatum]|uniref:Hydrolase, NUDIX family n=1 Tax=Oesophagostomum dentatum TaxID=61180 RepID=A0A0B1T5C8_OESDE|nr:hydrolase, NUDIX family [Oesophagostomum dentatum]